MTELFLIALATIVAFYVGKWAGQIETEEYFNDRTKHISTGLQDGTIYVCPVCKKMKVIE